MELQDKDYLLLSFFQQCLLAYESTELGQEMLASFERMFGIFTGSKNWDNWSKTVHFRFSDKPPSTTRELRVFNILHRAVKDRKVVEFDYKSPRNADPKHKSIEPHLMGWASALAAQQKIEKATEAYEKALGVNPKNANAMWDLGVMFESNYMPDKAEVAYLRAFNGLLSRDGDRDRHVLQGLFTLGGGDDDLLEGGRRDRRLVGGAGAAGGVNAEPVTIEVME